MLVFYDLADALEVDFSSVIESPCKALSLDSLGAVERYPAYPSCKISFAPARAATLTCSDGDFLRWLKRRVVLARLYFVIQSSLAWFRTLAPAISCHLRGPSLKIFSLFAPTGKVGFSFVYLSMSLIKSWC